METCAQDNFGKDKVIFHKCHILGHNLHNRAQNGFRGRFPMIWRNFEGISLEEGGKKFEEVCSS